MEETTDSGKSPLTEETDVTDAKECICPRTTDVIVVTDRLRTFIPQLKAANTLLGNATSIEDVDEDEEYVEMVRRNFASFFC